MVSTLLLHIKPSQEKKEKRERIHQRLDKQTGSIGYF